MAENDNQDPAILNVVIQQGETWAKTLTISKNNVAVDVTSYSFVLNIIQINGDVLSVPVTKTDPTNGIISWSFSAAESAKMLKTKHAWELVVTDTNSSVRNYIEGDFEVQ